MKRIKYLMMVIIGVVAVSLSSCSTSQKFTVQGIPGSVITSPQGQQLAVIDNSGQAQVVLKRKGGYFHYLQAQAPGSNLQVPFALDYNNHSRGARRAVGSTMACIGAIVALSGVLAIALGGDSGMTPGIGMVVGGAAFAGLGAPIGMVSPSINYDYDYQKNQTTNNDIIK